jgi:flavin reductase (NADH)
MSSEEQHRLNFRDAMASLPASVNIITTQGSAGRCGITATAVCSVTDTPPTLLVCINNRSAMVPVFEQNGKMCVNVLNHQQEEMARHFAGMTELSMDQRFTLDGWREGVLQQPILQQALASLEGDIQQIQSIGTHRVYLLEVKNITLASEGQGLIYFKRQFHATPHQQEVTA